MDDAHFVDESHVLHMAVSAHRSFFDVHSMDAIRKLSAREKPNNVLQARTYDKAFGLARRYASRCERRVH